MPRGYKSVKELNPNVPTAVMLTEADDAGAAAAYADKYDLRISYTSDADIRASQVRAPFSVVVDLG